MGRKWHRTVLFLLLAAALAACAVKPPVQEMAEARSAIESAKQLSPTQPEAQQELKSAEQSLKQAADALDREQYERARRKAIEAKRKAQRAAQYRSNQ
jgi:membrane-bound lytic murein transglycosylase